MAVSDQRFQMSESLLLGGLLALSGGFMDAYSYIGRGHVFANAQTGNLILLGIHLTQGEFQLTLRYLFPVLSFVAGIALAEAVRLWGQRRFHWRQVSVLCEALILLVVSFLPQPANLLANCLTSLACGIQVESFQKVHGSAVATTMCVGNLRKSTQLLVVYGSSGKKEYLYRSLIYAGLILSFVTGAVIGYAVVVRFSEPSIRICSALLALVFLLMFRERQISGGRKARG